MHIDIRSHIGPDTTIELNPPRIADDYGEQVIVPWYIRLDRYQPSNLHLRVETRADLARLRDAITAALDAHPEA